MKLTKNQKEMLTRLQAGEELHWQKYANGNPSHCHWGEWYPRCPNPIVTVRALIDKKLVEVYHGGKHGGDYTIVLQGA